MESRIKAPLYLDIYFFGKNELGKSREGRIPGIVNSLYEVGLIDCAKTLGQMDMMRKSGRLLHVDEGLRKIMDAHKFDKRIEAYLAANKKEILKELAVLEKRMDKLKN